MMATLEPDPDPEPDSIGKGRNPMESISRIAIRNMKPSIIDPNDPDQQRLIGRLLQIKGSIWEYSDNEPRFLARLNKNNPPAQRRIIESVVQPRSDEGSEAALSKEFNPLEGIPEDDLETDLNQSGEMLLKRKKPYQPAIVMSIGQSIQSPVTNAHHSARVILGPPEMKIVIKKTLELVEDMTKSVEFAYHAIRAAARFLSYPTPSFPSNNYVCGHIKGWIWIIYKGLYNLDPTGTDPSLIGPLLFSLHQEMSKLAEKASVTAEEFGIFNADLKALHGLVKKEAKVLKTQSSLWAARFDSYLKYTEEVLKIRPTLLVDTKEDRPFASDWIFDPHPSQSNLHTDSFHFQWIKTDKEWPSDNFEIRSDYSTRWTPYSELNVELQVALLTHAIDHVRAMLEETHNFIQTNMHLTFDFDEIKCLRFAIAEIHSMRKNKEAAEHIGDMTKTLFEDMALLQGIAQELTDQLNWIVRLMDPCYNDTVKRWIKPEKFQKLDFPRENMKGDGMQKLGWCGCWMNGWRSVHFLEIFGQPLDAVFLRSPITQETVDRFFPKDEVLLHRLETLPLAAPINPFGVSEHYVSSKFDDAMGRTRPTKKPSHLPKLRRKNLNTVVHFDPDNLNEATETTLQLPAQGEAELELETYLQIFEQIKAFFTSLGSMFHFLQVDLVERVDTLETRLYNELLDYYETLERMIKHEKVKGIIEANPGTCGTRAFRRIHAILIFFTMFIEGVIPLDDNGSTHAACKTAYYKSYSKYQSWFTQKGAMFSIYFIPNKKTLYGRICPGRCCSGSGSEEITKIDSEFKVFVASARRVIDHCEAVFKMYDLADV